MTAARRKMVKGVKRGGEAAAGRQPENDPLLTGRQLLTLMAVRKLMAETGEAVSTRDARAAVARATGRDVDRSNFVNTARAMAQKGWMVASAKVDEATWQPRLHLVVTPEGEDVLAEMLAAVRALDIP